MHPPCRRSTSDVRMLVGAVVVLASLLTLDARSSAHGQCVLPNPIPDVVSFVGRPGTDLDTGWTGQAHDLDADAQAPLTAARLGNCDVDTASATCGQCTLNGPVLFPGTAGAAIAAKAGYPSVQVPAGFVAGVRDKETPDYPYGATFTGRAWGEPTLLRLAYAFEQATQARRPPPGLPALDPGCAP